METDIVRSYLTAFSELVERGDERTRHLTRTQKKHYEDLKQQIVEKHRAKLSANESPESLLADISNGYERLSPFWQMR